MVPSTASEPNERAIGRVGGCVREDGDHPVDAYTGSPFVSFLERYTQPPGQSPPLILIPFQSLPFVFFLQNTSTHSHPQDPPKTSPRPFRHGPPLRHGVLARLVGHPHRHPRHLHPLRYRWHRLPARRSLWHGENRY